MEAMPMSWFYMTRLTGESGSSDADTLGVWVNGDSIQFLQPASRGTRVFLRAGALDSIDVVEDCDEIFRKGQKSE
jgi:hypothetical protein